ncbi:MAG: pantoate--beta-alanine ligase [Shewanellaceae bacterium]|nr:pantoate--beta-alanine ligase [Shewanellaceae bacterium]
MKVYNDINAWLSMRKELSTHLSLGVVMTMGALHEGHLSLMRQSKQENDRTLVTIFVNPTQFDNKNDLQKYPKTWESDCDLLQQVEIDYLLAPRVSHIYPAHDYFYMNENHFSQQLCGLSRPNHFQGVLTIVLKLLNLAQAQRAYFGEKDYQQAKLIQKMTQCFFLPTQIILHPTIRDPDGLALSSRNTRLSETGREKATFFARLLKTEKSVLNMKHQLELEGIQVDYLEEIGQHRFGAVWIEDIRLIDNCAKP